MLAWADLPDVQIQHADIVAQRLGNRLGHPGRRRIQQHIRRAVQQATAPTHNHHRPHQPHDRIQPAPAGGQIEPTGDHHAQRQAQTLALVQGCDSLADTGVGG